jgi:uncharacterized membrane protein/thiol-disulfide isomerase/thioredoxin
MIMLRGLRRWLRWLLIASLTLVFLSAPAVQAEPAVVRAVLFYSPTCPHCHQVINEDLPPLIEKYGEQLHIIGIDVTQPDGQVLFQATIDRFKLEHVGVPTLVVDDVVLIGSLEIPEQFPGLVEKYLAQGGTEWPTIPGLVELINSQVTPEPTEVAAVPTVATAVPQLTPSPVENKLLVSQPAAVDVWSNVTHDPIGNGLAIVVLFGMIGSVAAVAVVSRRAPINQAQSAWREWAIPVLCLIGLAVAGYLTYVEAAQVAAVCGPVGDCNTVQQSEYARLFGRLPIGVLGLIGYVAIIVAWGIERWGRAPLDRLAAFALVIMTFGGMLFSIYLTFLEPFVIGATCAWCLTSAVLMTALLWLTVTPQRLALIKHGSTS